MIAAVFPEKRESGFGLGESTRRVAGQKVSLVIRLKIAGKKMLVDQASISLIVLAGILSLVPLLVLLYVYVLREKEPTVSRRAVLMALGSGMLAVPLAAWAEEVVYRLWQFGDTLCERLYPPCLPTSQYFIETVESVSSFGELFFIALAAFGFVAVIEEILRFVLLDLVFRLNRDIDQIIDGVQLGVVAGLGFAFVENASYFLRPFRDLEFDTLVVIFFLRFMIATFGHISFGAVMGYYLARARMNQVFYRSLRRRAFWIPWAMHGVFDVLLALALGYYTVLLLVIPVAVVWSWYHNYAFLAIRVRGGRVLRVPIPFRPSPVQVLRRAHVVPLQGLCGVCLRQVVHGEERCPSCGALLEWKKIPRRPRHSPAVLAALPRTSEE
jgi:RsiW-degrading membrane proteinase PrsW (M82 family)